MSEDKDKLVMKITPELRAFFSAVERQHNGMARSVTEIEKEAVVNALDYYVYIATHDPEKMNGSSGLPEGREKRLIESAIKKIKDSCHLAEDEQSQKDEEKKQDD